MKIGGRKCIMQCEFDNSELTISLHKLPGNEKLRELWIEAMDLDSPPGKNSQLCTLHFEEKYIDRFEGRARLRIRAIPTIFAHSNYEVIQEVRRKHDLEFGIHPSVLRPEVAQGPPPPNLQIKTIPYLNHKAIPYDKDNTFQYMSVPKEDTGVHKEHNYMSKFEVVNEDEIKLENDDPLQIHEEQIYPTAIGVAHTDPTEYPDTSTDNQYLSFNWDESTSKIHTDLESTCRMCMAPILTQSDNGCMSLFNYEEIPISLEELKIAVNDGLPQRICKACCHIFDMMKIFLQQAIRSQEILQKHFMEKVEINIEPVDECTEDLSVEFKDILDNGTEEECVEEKTPTKDYLGIDHLDTGNISDKYCEICDKTFPYKSKKLHHMKMHMRKNNGSKDKPKISVFECNICGANSFKSRSYLNRHLKIHSTVVQTCPMCSATFTNPYSYQYHLKSHDPNKKYKCQYCDKSFLQSHHLFNHENSHTGYRPCLCSICGKSYSTAGYRQHMGTHTGIPVRKKYKPSAAAKRARQKYALKHYNKPMKMYSCDVCGKKFDCKAIYVHRRTHTKPLECKYCYRRFATKVQLYLHITRNHNGNNEKVVDKCDDEERTHACTQCDSAFKRYAHLKSHIRFVHLKEKPLECTVCGKRFGQSGTLKEHMATHSEERPFPCTKCPSKFRTNRLLQGHMLTHDAAAI